jgi:hypothetical protein
MTETQSQACSVQPTEQVTSPRASPPRRVLRSRQGRAGVMVPLDDGGTSVIMALGTASEYLISKCKDKRCLTCKNLEQTQTVTSNVSGRTYQAKNFSGHLINGHSQNIIYLCSCLSCGIQYVGETIQPLNERINVHRTSKEGCEHCIRHCSEVCNGYNFKFQILEKLPGNGYRPNGEIDSEMRKLRKSREDIWMKKLRTIYPYGLNEKAINKETNSSVLEPAIGKLFPPLNRNGPRTSRPRDNRNEKNSQISCPQFFEKLEHLFTNDIRNSFNEIRKTLNLAKKKVLKDIAFHIIERDGFEFHENRFQWYHYILDIIDTKLLKIPEVKKKSNPKNVIVVNFVNKGMDNIHLNSILSSAEVTNLLPPALQSEEDRPMCTMKLSTPIRNKILNYKETVASLDIVVDDEVSFVRNLPPCSCESSDFSDPFHKHIITGDLRVVENPKLRKLLSKGPNFRESKMLNYSKCRNEIQSSILSSMESLSEKYNLPIESFEEWRDKISLEVNKRVNKLKSKNTPATVKPVLEDEAALSALNDLHSRFVVVPIDKASNNVAIICKRFYIQKLLTEVGVPGNTSPTYQMSDRNQEDVIADNLLLCEKFGLSFDDRMKTVPFMYWLPKMHYTPPRCRFIVASSSCSTKPLSKITSKIYKHIFNQVRNYHYKSKFYKNYNRFWPIENSFPVIEKITKINSKKKAKDISTYDFSTLYTKLPHDELIKNLNEIVDFAFKGGNDSKDGNRKYLTIRGSTSFWSKVKHGKDSFTRSDIKLLTIHLIKETYFTIGNLLFKQFIGIPMGIDPAPFWANLHLYSYEYSFILSLMKSDKRRAFKFENSVRFIDDNCNINDGGEFGRSFREIYPSNLELKCEHEGTHATFLELDIKKVDDIFVYKLFDKRDGFAFFIVRMPDLSGNIPSHVFYGSVMSEFLRIARCTLLYSDFLPSIISLFKRMLNQGGSENKLLMQIKKAFDRHPSSFDFNKTFKEIIADIKSGCVN